MTVRAHVLIARFGDKRRHLLVVAADSRQEAMSLAAKCLGGEVTLEPHGNPLEPEIAASLGLTIGELRSITAGTGLPSDRD